MKVTMLCTINGVPKVTDRTLLSVPDMFTYIYIHNYPFKAVASAVCSLPPPAVVTPAPRSQSSLSRGSRASVGVEGQSQSDVNADALATIEQIVTKSSELLKNKEIADVQTLDSCLE